MFENQNQRPKQLKKINSSNFNLYNPSFTNNTYKNSPVHYMPLIKPLKNHNNTNHSTYLNTPLSHQIQHEIKKQSSYVNNIIQTQPNMTQSNYNNEYHRRMVTNPNCINKMVNKTGNQDTKHKISYSRQTQPFVSKYSAQVIKPKSQLNLFEESKNHMSPKLKHQNYQQKTKTVLKQQIQRLNRKLSEKQQKISKLEKEMIGLRNIRSNDLLLLTEFHQNEKQLVKKIQVLELKIIEQSYQIKLLKIKNENPKANNNEELCLIVQQSFVESLIGSLIGNSQNEEYSNLSLSNNSSKDQFQDYHSPHLDFKQCYLQILNLFGIKNQSGSHHLLIQQITTLREKSQFLLTQLTHSEIKIKKLQQSYNNLIPELSLYRNNSDKSSINVSTQKCSIQESSDNQRQI